MINLEALRERCCCMTGYPVKCVVCQAVDEIKALRGTAEPPLLTLLLDIYTQVPLGRYPEISARIESWLVGGQEKKS